jgi:hypothetical protein
VVDKPPVPNPFFPEFAIESACRIAFTEKIYSKNRLPVAGLTCRYVAVEENEIFFLACPAERIRYGFGLAE